MLNKPLSSSSLMFSPRLPINKVLQGGLSFVFCRSTKNSNENKRDSASYAKQDIQKKLETSLENYLKNTVLGDSYFQEATDKVCPARATAGNLRF